MNIRSEAVESAVTQIFKSWVERYGQSFKYAYAEDLGVYVGAMNTELQQLEISIVQLRKAFKESKVKYIDRPPSISQFIYICNLIKHDIPSEEDVYDECAGFSSLSSADRSGFEWSHIIIKLVMRDVKTESFNKKQEHIVRKTLKDAYNKYVRSVMAGNKLPDYYFPEPTKMTAQELTCSLRADFNEKLGKYKNYTTKQCQEEIKKMVRGNDMFGFLQLD